MSLKKIAAKIGKHHSTIAREIRSRRTTRNKGDFGRITNRCILRGLRQAAALPGQAGLRQTLCVLLPLQRTLPGLQGGRMREALPSSLRMQRMQRGVKVRPAQALLHPQSRARELPRRLGQRQERGEHLRGRIAIAQSVGQPTDRERAVRPPHPRQQPRLF